MESSKQRARINTSRASTLSHHHSPRYAFPSDLSSQRESSIQGAESRAKGRDRPIARLQAADRACSTNMSTSIVKHSLIVSHRASSVPTNLSLPQNDAEPRLMRSPRGAGKFMERNRRFRDIEFDLEEDRERCLHGLDTPEDGGHKPADVMRVSQLYEKPAFFIDGANCSDIMQGRLGDCWFLSALAIVSTVGELIDKICVARDEKVGVYGFIFFRDSTWVDVIIDDLLYTSLPKYDQLSSPERNLYHFDRDKYNSAARKGGKGLYFAKGGTENETWVYVLVVHESARLSNLFAVHLLRKHTPNCTATTLRLTEDMLQRPSRILLDEDRFWEEELLRVNQDRLFGCFIYNTDDSGESELVNGLFAGHAYSVISALEVNGKRFLRLRNPWGKVEWTGAWSDGSKEWTAEWLAFLPQLQHKFGNDGEFLMEYKDFLATWTIIERCRLFNSDWKLSSMWINATSRGIPSRGFAALMPHIVTLNVTESSPAVIVLSQLDDRYFSQISGRWAWSLEFYVYRKDSPSTEPYAISEHTMLWRRNVHVELGKLEAGEYVVHVRLDRDVTRSKDAMEESMSKWNLRKLSQVLTEMGKSHSVAVKLLPAPTDIFGGQDLTAIELAFHEKDQEEAAKKRAAPDSDSDSEDSESSSDEESESEVVVTDPSLVSVPDSPTEPPTIGATPEDPAADSESDDDTKSEATVESDTAPKQGKSQKEDVPPPNSAMGVPRKQRSDNSLEQKFPIVGARYKCLNSSCPNYDLCSKCMGKNVHNPDHQMLCIRTPEDASKLARKDDDSDDEEDNSITLGLRVYTQGEALTTIAAQLRHGNLVGWRRKE
ncbi:calpain [Rhizoctonia solani AG-1 IA]|uniref:Calpain n=1 Tax=Thanatephorus cucumeris (strain AG1-IA) TaxID=983506 RepID=L8X2F6_THACA|nr:calpain [Rhizoctonia solani AG-1 IA]